MFYNFCCSSLIWSYCLMFLVVDFLYLNDFYYKVPISDLKIIFLKYLNVHQLMPIPSYDAIHSNTIGTIGIYTMCAHNPKKHSSNLLMIAANACPIF